MKKAKHINEQPLTVEQKKKAKARRNAIGWTVFLILLAAVVTALVLLPRMMNRPVEEDKDVQTFEAAPAAIGSAIAFGVAKAVNGLRVTEDVEREGLDLGEHGERAYNY